MVTIFGNAMIDSSMIVEKLGRKTIHQALKGKTAEKRANAVLKIGREIRSASLSDGEMAFAAKLMERICQDVSELVRRALSVTLRTSPHLPHHIAKRLIEDIDSIAIPILAESPVIVDDDLISVLNSRAAKKIRAIAQRQTLGLHISLSLIHI